MRVYVTGASGFVGSNLVRVYAAGAAEVVTLPDLRTQLGRLREQIDTGRIEQEDTITA